MEAVWKPYVQSAEDEWVKTSDPVARRRAQNRLSQRARRTKRGNLKDKHPLTKSTQQDLLLASEIITEDSPVLLTDVILPTIDSTNLESLELVKTSSTTALTFSEDLPSFADLENFMYGGNDFALDLAVPAADTHFLIIQPLRACEAFGRIITILNLQCTHDLILCNPVAPNIPTSLMPVREQRTIPHLMYIDMLPWASLRRNLLTRLSTFNQVEFTKDMTGDHLRVWGCTPWDPMSWEVSEEFLQKWFFLLDATVLLPTNFWRGQRGEPALSFPNNWNAVEC